MKNSEQIDQILTQAFSPTVEPGREINRNLRKQLEEMDSMRYKNRKRIPVLLLIAILTLVVSVTALAARELLNPKQVAKRLFDTALIQAFDSEEAIKINKSVVSGGYEITLLGIVSGRELSNRKYKILNSSDNSYIAVAIAKEDGSPLPDNNKETSKDLEFSVSPLIKGKKPWQYNLYSMHGGFSKFTQEGVLYYMVECSNIEIYADRGLYLSVNQGNYIDSKAFNYSETTGIISTNPDYDGVNVLFDLPLDESKANYAKAEKFLSGLFRVDLTEKYDPEKSVDFAASMKIAEIIPESVKEVTTDQYGLINYEYKGDKMSDTEEDLFKEGQIGLSDIISYMTDESQTIRSVIRFSRDENGIIKGMVFELKYE